VEHYIPRRFANCVGLILKPRYLVLPFNNTAADKQYGRRENCWIMITASDEFL
jgi:hypothetical protein